ncbi:MAG: FAD-binding oxidoreductase [Lewinellaceae bacterium]|nr:FAD-binding oxidoreductase [Lewinellaceae bacterium]MCB9356911.1 FAD-binding oxidoreductase [Lewinellaceae bacterium]
MKKTLMVGAGVVNLVSAYFLAKANHRLTIVDKGPNPLYPAFWKKLGCTFGGENVRMFTYTEADNYNEKGSQLYSRMDEAFERVIGDSGWLVRPKETLNAQEQAWIQDFHAVSPADAIQFGEEIYRVNISSGKIWQQWMEEAPELFDDVDLVQDILRIYSDPADFHAAQKLHGRLGSLTEVLSTESALEKYPLFKSARSADMLGGCMMVKGFTLKVQDFCKKIIRHLMDAGVEFRWNANFSGIQKNWDGAVTGVIIDDKMEQYDHYVLSLGAYAGATLENTRTGNQLHGVLGVWLSLPNIYPELKHSMKIHKTGRVGEDTNVTLIEQHGEPVLVLGSGYGYTGNATKNNISNSELQGIFDSVKHTAQTYFPEAYAMVKDRIDGTGKYCVRSWTPTGLGVFETIPTVRGGHLIVTGGNNTGGFTQAPYIADAVLSTLRNKIHPLQSLFAPQRMRRSIESSIS